MFKVGDKIVCVYDTFTGIYKSEEIFKHHVYIVNDISRQFDHLIEIEGSDLYYETTRFISLTDFRKRKIKKIYDVI